LHNTHVEVKVVRTGQNGEHGEFLITERSRTEEDEAQIVDEVEIFNFLSLGKPLIAWARPLHRHFAY
jgi:hypothetical protein